MNKAVLIGGVAAAGVIGTVSGHRADLFTFRDLVEQLRQDRTVAVAAGCKLHRPDVRSGRIHGQMDLAPLAAALNTVLSRLPFAPSPMELDAGAVNKQVQRAIGTPVRDLDLKCFLPPTQVVWSGTAQSRPANFSGLATIPVVCRKGSLNKTLIVNQNWIAASENTAARPGLPPGDASQVISLSSQISNEPHLGSAAL